MYCCVSLEFVKVFEILVCCLCVGAFDGCVCIVLVLFVCVCVFGGGFARRGYCFWIVLGVVVLVRVLVLVSLK